PEGRKDAVLGAAERVLELPIVILPPDFGDVASVNAGLREAEKKLGGVDLLIIDYAQLLGAPGRTEYERATEVSRSLKRLAVQRQIPLVALSQLSRALDNRDDKRPVLSDLRQTGQLEQDADAVVFCFREEYYLEREEPDLVDSENHAAWRSAMAACQNQLELIVAKNRQGQIGTAKVRINLKVNHIWDDSGYGGSAP
ncbi:MAG: DnaB-like helicase C-terminal domain-containing protein, partial [Pseudomonadota bacterium]